MKEIQYGMPPPNSRLEFEHNIYLVIEDGHRRINSGNESMKQNFAWATYKHLKKVKALPNRRMNLLTIDENLRLQSNMHKWMESMPAHVARNESPTEEE